MGSFSVALFLKFFKEEKTASVRAWRGNGVINVCVRSHNDTTLHTSLRITSVHYNAFQPNITIQPSSSALVVI